MLGTQDGAWGVDTALKTFVWQVWCGRHVCQAAPSVCSHHLRPAGGWYDVQRQTCAHMDSGSWRKSQGEGWAGSVVQGPKC